MSAERGLVNGSFCNVTPSSILFLAAFYKVILDTFSWSAEKLCLLDVIFFTKKFVSVPFEYNLM